MKVLCSCRFGRLAYYFFCSLRCHIICSVCKLFVSEQIIFNKKRKETFLKHLGYDLQISEFSCHGKNHMRAGPKKCLADIKIVSFVLKTIGLNHSQEHSRTRLTSGKMYVLYGALSANK